MIEQPSIIAAFTATNGIREAERATANARSDALRELVGALQPDQALRRTNELLNEYQNALLYKVGRERTLRRLRTQIEEHKAIIFLNGAIDGKNEAQRNAQLVLALAADADYQAARTQIDDYEAEVAALNVTIDLSQRELDLAKLKLRIAAASIEALSS